ncbi:MAG: hypothetical protein RMK89_01130 [Armatimonadota bacterium]|nr:hypothetical protein [Armatimonadota bacterium]MDW8142040.1 hypothetical protein [Armatimonadota bacterium]
MSFCICFGEFDFCPTKSWFVAQTVNLRHIHATGFSQWSLTKQNERRIHSAGLIVVRPKKFGTTVVVPSEWLKKSEGQATARPKNSARR